MSAREPGSIAASEGIQFSAVLECAPCEKVVGALVAPDLGTLGALSAGWALCAHATPPHCGHQQAAAFKIQAAELLGSRDIEFHCLHQACVEKNAPAWRTRCPIELAPALAILFHTGHEGHRFRFTYDGVTFESPES